MAIRKKKFYRLLPNSLHTFNVKAWSMDAISDWSDDIKIQTSQVLPLEWPDLATTKMVAKPAYFTRCIKVRWTPMVGYPLRFNRYVLFRKDCTDELGYSDPSAAEIKASAQAIQNETLDSNPHFLKDMGKINFYYDRVSVDLDDEADNEGLPYSKILISGQVEKEHQYYYWVFAVDNNNQVSASDLDALTTPSNYLIDNAEFGKPNKPVVLYSDMQSEESTTSVHDRIKWMCDVQLRWRCVDGAEFYWVRRRMYHETIERMWGLPIYVENNPTTGDLQSVTINNLFCGRKYQFQVKAVNVPYFLASEWSEDDDQYYETETDPYPPPEIQNVSAKRFRRFLIEKGDYIKLMWDAPDNPILGEQIDHYNIYRLTGTENQAETYVNTINAGTADVYAETRKMGGTHFIDDYVEELEDAAAIAPEDICTFFWNGEYGSHTENDQKTAYVSGDGATEVGTLSATGEGVIDGGGGYDGEYLLRSVKLTGTLTFSDVEDAIPQGDTYVSFRFQVASDFDFSGPYSDLGIMIFNFTGEGNYVNFTFDEGQLIVSRVGGGGYRTVTHSKVWSWLADRYIWHHIEARWSIDLDVFQVRVDDGDWESAAGGVAMEDYSVTCDQVVIGLYSRFGSNMGDCGTRYDRVFVYNSFNVPNFDSAPQAYHYWVTAEDVDGKESVATMDGVGISKSDDDRYHNQLGTGQSHDVVTFGPPDAPVLRNPAINLTMIFSMSMFTIKLIWESVEEATHYRVRIRFKIPGRLDWGPWMYSVPIREEIAAHDEQYPFYVYPFPVRKFTTFQWAVSAKNYSEETWSSDSSEIEVIADTEPPSDPYPLEGRCYGYYWGYGLKYRWIATRLRWRPNSNYEGVSNYIIYRDGEYLDTVRHNPWKGGAFKTYQVYWDYFASDVATENGTHTYSVYAYAGDTDEISENPSTVVVTWQRWWTF